MNAEAEWRMMTNVRESEFEVGEDGVYHVATGAMFWAHPESSEFYQTDWANAHDVDEEGQPLFDASWIAHVAKVLLKHRRN